MARSAPFNLLRLAAISFMEVPQKLNHNCMYGEVCPAAISKLVRVLFLDNFLFDKTFKLHFIWVRTVYKRYIYNICFK